MRACGLESQGLDDAAPFGVEAFIRGQVNDSWAAVPVPANKLINFGGNVLKVELDTATASSTPGLKNFKVAGASWDDLNCGADGPAVVTTGTAYTMRCSTAAGGPPNLQWTPDEESCYEFAFNASNPDAPIITITKADLSIGGGEEPEDTIEIRIYEVDVLTPGAAPTLKTTVAGSDKVDVAEVRRGGETRITRIEIENKSGGDISIPDFSWTANPRFALAAKPVDVFYRRPSGGYANTRLTIGGTTYTCTPDNAFGCVVRGVPVLPFANVTITVSNGTGTPNETINFNAGNATMPVYTFSGSPYGRLGTPGEPGKPLAAIPRNANEVIVFYKRDDGVYTDWGVHLVPDRPGDRRLDHLGGPAWVEGVDPLYGAYFRITLPQNAVPPYSNAPGALATFPNVLGMIIHKGDTKDPGPDQFIRIAQDGNMLFVVSGVNDLSTVPPVGSAVRILGAGAHWVLDDTVLWQPAPSAGVTKVELLFSPDGTIKSGVNGIEGTFQTIPLVRWQQSATADDEESEHLCRVLDPGRHRGQREEPGTRTARDRRPRHR